MIRFSVFFLLLSFSISVKAQNYSDLISAAKSAFEQGDFSVASAKYEAAFELVGSPLPEDLYQAAKSFTLNGQLNEGFDLLNQAISGGWMDLENTLNDRDLIELQKDDRWPETLNRMLEKQGQEDIDFARELKRELQEIDSLDQLYRTEIANMGDAAGWESIEIRNLWLKQAVLDSLNLLRITQIFDHYGYPDASMVGVLNEVPMQIVLHSGTAVQEAYLPYFESAANEGHIPSSYLAELTDLVLIGKGEPQLYGTQLVANPDSGKLGFAPISNPEKVNERRESMGLEPIEDYAKRFGIKYKRK